MLLLHSGTEPHGSLSWAYAHAAFMFLSWALLVPSTVFIARYNRKLWPVLWFNIHFYVNVIAIVSTLIGFFCILKFYEGHLYLYEIHHVLGFMIVLGCILQGVLGVVSDKMYNPDRRGPPIFPDQVHWALGQLLMLGSLYNIYLGFGMTSIPWSDWVKSFAICILLLVCSAFIFTPRLSNGHGHQDSTLAEHPGGGHVIIVAVLLCLLIVFPNLWTPHVSEMDDD